jgi:hypothetical protein
MPTTLPTKTDTSSLVMVKRDMVLTLWASIVSERLGQPKPDEVWQRLEKAFGDRLSEVKVAMEMLADRYSLDELNRRSYELYKQFQPATPKGSALNMAKITAADTKHLN